VSVRRRRLLLRLSLVALASALAFEVSLRALLFADFARDWPLAVSLREPQLFAHWSVDDLYWQLQLEFAGGSRRPPPAHDPLLGWVSEKLQGAERLHRDADTVGERRPVLLFGDSYAACRVAPGGCFEDALERSALGRSHRLLNHGVGGYGLGQIALLFDATVEHFVDRDPLVVIGVLVDSDLDRAALSLRGWPKPRIERARGGGWSFEPEPVAPSSPGTPGAPGAPPFATSYAARLLLHGWRAVPAGVHDALCAERELGERNRERCAAILAWVAEGLERRGLESFFLLFHRRGSLEDPAEAGWREPFLVAQLDALGLPWVSTRAPLLSHAAASGRSPSDYYGPDGHMNALGNETAFRALAQGLAGRFGDRPQPAWSEAELRGPLAPDQIAEVVLGGRRAAARYELGARPPFEASERSRLCFRAATQGPTEVRYELDGRASAFEARARLIPMGKLGPGEGSVGLTVLVDGEERFRHVVRRGDEPLPIRVDLRGGDSLVLRIDDAGDGIRGDWLVLANPVFHARDG